MAAVVHWVHSLYFLLAQQVCRIGKTRKENQKQKRKEKIIRICPQIMLSSWMHVSYQVYTVYHNYWKIAWNDGPDIVKVAAIDL
ncbi:hypothetical protein F4801DRAFT_537228 [Xylaria longipes]|nr:hypothetical protein F4801DRAFT_537228 [Xylaria longipes]